MKRILLAAQGRLAYLHTPRMLALLRKSGCQVDLARIPEGLPEEVVVALTGKEPVPFETAGYDAVLLAPCKNLNFSSQDGIPVCRASEEGSGEDVLASLPGDTWLVDEFGEDGALASPEQCLEAVLSALAPQDLAGTTLLLTAGPTIEDADPARYVSNRSTGRMGCAIARMAARRGASVILVHGPMQASVPKSARILPVPVRSAAQMLEAVEAHIASAQVAVLCAAVADFTPMQYSEEKIKKGKAPTFSLTMRKNPDILATLGAMPDKPFLVGFAAESNNVGNNAMEKLERKHADLLCANDITAPGCGFAVNTNRLIVFGTNHFQTEIPLAAKEDVADQLLDIIQDRRKKSAGK